MSDFGQLNVTLGPVSPAATKAGIYSQPCPWILGSAIDVIFPDKAEVALDSQVCFHS